MPRTIRHWTPRYIVNRLTLAYHERVAPRDPWITRTACRFLADWLGADDAGLEWGSGRSTIWFAERVRKLTSVEDNPQWYALVRSRLAERNLSNVDLRLAPPQPASGSSPYVSVASEFAPGSLDFVLVDGQLRSQCTDAALDLIKPGGILVLDNAQRYVPHPSHSPGAIVRAGGANDDWQPVLARLSSWRQVWTSNGVQDTAIYHKPVAR